MTDEKIEKRLEKEIASMIPDDAFDKILEDCGEQIEVVDFNAKKRPSIFRRAALAAAALVMVVGGVIGYSQNSANAIDSVIELDVNPSIELRLNAKDRIISAEALNGDGMIILDGMDLAGTDIDVAVNAIVGSMLKNGYISELANSVLVTVENQDGKKAAELEKRIVDDITGLLNGVSIDAALLSQTVHENDEIKQLANKYGISIGKASLIQSILSSNSRYTFDDLAKLSINDLNLIAGQNTAGMDSIHSVGTASDKKYISRDNALNAALAHAGISKENASEIDVEFDCEDGKMVYEVEFSVNGKEYEYDVDAESGDIIKTSTDTYDDDDDDDD